MSVFVVPLQFCAKRGMARTKALSADPSTFLLGSSIQGAIYPSLSFLGALANARPDPLNRLWAARAPTVPARFTVADRDRLHRRGQAVAITMNLPTITASMCSSRVTHDR